MDTELSFGPGVCEADNIDRLVRNGASMLLGATVFGFVLTKMRVPQQVVELVLAIDLSTTGFLLLIMGLIFLLGMFLESIAIILITTPVSMNLFTIKAISRAPIIDIIRGAAPFVVLLLLGLLVVLTLPELALWLPETMYDTR